MVAPEESQQPEIKSADDRAIVVKKEEYLEYLQEKEKMQLEKEKSQKHEDALRWFLTILGGVLSALFFLLSLGSASVGKLGAFLILLSAIIMCPLPDQKFNKERKENIKKGEVVISTILLIIGFIKLF